MIILNIRLAMTKLTFQIRVENSVSNDEIYAINLGLLMRKQIHFLVVYDCVNDIRNNYFVL